jgi:hypothetical protein
MLKEAGLKCVVLFWCGVVDAEIGILHQLPSSETRGMGGTVLMDTLQLRVRSMSSVYHSIIIMDFVAHP